MALRENILNELKRSPIAIMIGACGLVIAAMTLLFAWIQHQDQLLTLINLNHENIQFQKEIHLENLTLVIGYFIAITTGTAFLVRTLARKHDIAAFLLSMPIAALTNFSTVLIFYIAPPKALSQNTFSSAHDLIFYASTFIYLAFCGLSVFRDFATTNNKDVEPTKEKQDVLAVFFFCLIILGVWGSIVFSGQETLTKTLLPDIAHYIDQTP